MGKTGSQESVTVGVRCRPLTEKETSSHPVVVVAQNTVTVNPTGGSGPERSFSFDYSYGPDTTQEQIYQDIGSVVMRKALDGYNGTIFVYGQTGAGKTHTMMGTEGDPGIVPRLLEDLFLTSSAHPHNTYNISACYLELYNEVIYDLLSPSRDLKIRESTTKGVYVEGLSAFSVASQEEAFNLMLRGNQAKTMASTAMNERSSRSHSVFSLRVESTPRGSGVSGPAGSPAKVAIAPTGVGGCSSPLQTRSPKAALRPSGTFAKVNLVDLAGSERAGGMGSTGIRFREGTSINKSLTALGNVINALASGTKSHIPYRDSKLTRLLQESLGGNMSTAMIAAISPAASNVTETLGTLQYASRAKSIKNETRKNEDPTTTLIRQLREEIVRLKALTSSVGPTVSAAPQGNTGGAFGIHPRDFFLTTGANRTSSLQFSTEVGRTSLLENPVSGGEGVAAELTYATRVVATRVVQSEYTKPHRTTEYVLRVDVRSYPPYFLARSFETFHTLRSQLERRYHVESIPELPGGSILDVLDTWLKDELAPEVRNERAQGINTFLSSILKHPTLGNCPEVVALLELSGFLHMRQHPKHYSTLLSYSLHTKTEGVGLFPSPEGPRPSMGAVWQAATSAPEGTFVPLPPPLAGEIVGEYTIVQSPLPLVSAPPKSRLTQVLGLNEGAYVASGAPTSGRLSFLGPARTSVVTGKELDDLGCNGGMAKLSVTIHRAPLRVVAHALRLWRDYTIYRHGNKALLSLVTRRINLMRMQWTFTCWVNGVWQLQSSRTATQAVQLRIHRSTLRMAFESWRQRAAVRARLRRASDALTSRVHMRVLLRALEGLANVASLDPPAAILFREGATADSWRAEVDVWYRPDTSGARTNGREVEQCLTRNSARIGSVSIGFDNSEDFATQRMLWCGVSAGPGIRLWRRKMARVLRGWSAVCERAIRKKELLYGCCKRLLVGLLRRVFRAWVDVAASFSARRCHISASIQRIRRNHLLGSIVRSWASTAQLQRSQEARVRLFTSRQIAAHVRRAFHAWQAVSVLLLSRRTSASLRFLRCQRDLLKSVLLAWHSEVATSQVLSNKATQLGRSSIWRRERVVTRMAFCAWVSCIQALQLAQCGALRMCMRRDRTLARASLSAWVMWVDCLNTRRAEARQRGFLAHVRSDSHLCGCILGEWHSITVEALRRRRSALKCIAAISSRSLQRVTWEAWRDTRRRRHFIDRRIRLMALRRVGTLLESSFTSWQLHMSSARQSERVATVRRAAMLRLEQKQTSRAVFCAWAAATLPEADEGRVSKICQRWKLRSVVRAWHRFIVNRIDIAHTCAQYLARRSIRTLFIAWRRVPADRSDVVAMFFKSRQTARVRFYFATWCRQCKQKTHDANVSHVLSRWRSCRGVRTCFTAWKQLTELRTYSVFVMRRLELLRTRTVLWTWFHWALRSRRVYDCGERLLLRRQNTLMRALLRAWYNVATFQTSRANWTRALKSHHDKHSLRETFEGWRRWWYLQRAKQVLQKNMSLSQKKSFFTMWSGKFQRSVSLRILMRIITQKMSSVWLCTCVRKWYRWTMGRIRRRVAAERVSERIRVCFLRTFFRGFAYYTSSVSMARADSVRKLEHVHYTSQWVWVRFCFQALAHWSFEKSQRKAVAVWCVGVWRTHAFMRTSFLRWKLFPALRRSHKRQVDSLLCVLRGPRLRNLLRYAFGGWRRHVRLIHEETTLWKRAKGRMSQKMIHDVFVAWVGAVMSLKELRNLKNIASARIMKMRLRFFFSLWHHVTCALLDLRTRETNLRLRHRAIVLRYCVRTWFEISATYRARARKLISVRNVLATRTCARCFDVWADAVWETKGRLRCGMRKMDRLWCRQAFLRWRTATADAVHERALVQRVRWRMKVKSVQDLFGIWRDFVIYKRLLRLRLQRASQRVCVLRRRAVLRVWRAGAREDRESRSLHQAVFERLRQRLQMNALWCWRCYTDDRRQKRRYAQFVVQRVQINIVRRVFVNWHAYTHRYGSASVSVYGGGDCKVESADNWCSLFHSRLLCKRSWRGWGDYVELRQWKRRSLRMGIVRVTALRLRFTIWAWRDTILRSLWCRRVTEGALVRQSFAARAKAFSKWRSITSKEKDQRTLLEAVQWRMHNKRLGNALRAWRAFVDEKARERERAQVVRKKLVRGMLYRTFAAWTHVAFAVAHDGMNGHTNCDTYNCNDNKTSQVCSDGSFPARIIASPDNSDKM